MLLSCRSSSLAETVQGARPCLLAPPMLRLAAAPAIRIEYSLGRCLPCCAWRRRRPLRSEPNIAFGGASHAAHGGAAASDQNRTQSLVLLPMLRLAAPPAIRIERSGWCSLPPMLHSAAPLAHRRCVDRGCIECILRIYRESIGGPSRLRLLARQQASTASQTESLGMDNECRRPNRTCERPVPAAVFSSTSDRRERPESNGGDRNRTESNGSGRKQAGSGRNRTEAAGSRPE